jgi:hypothetical protein
MTATEERQTLADLAELGGWQRRNVERTDYYTKGGALPRRRPHRVHAGAEHGPGLAETLIS